MKWARFSNPDSICYEFERNPQYSGKQIIQIVFESEDKTYIVFYK